MKITDYLGNSVEVKNPTSSSTSIKSRSYDIEKSYFTEGLKFIKPTDDEVEEKYRRWMASSGECFYCGRKTKSLNNDHLVPNSHTGDKSGTIIAHTIHEFVPCCSECNGSTQKGGKDPLEWYTDPKTIRYLKQCGLTNEMYAAKLDAMKYDIEHLKYLNISDEAYEMADRDINMKDNFVRLFTMMARIRNHKILQDNGFQVVLNKDDIPSQDDINAWMELNEVMERHGLKVQKCRVDTHPEDGAPLF